MERCMDMSGHVSTPVPVAFIPQTHKQLREESGQGAGRGAEGGALRGAGEGRRVSGGCSRCQVGRARSRIHALFRIYPRPLLLRLIYMYIYICICIYICIYMYMYISVTGPKRITPINLTPFTPISPPPQPHQHTFIPAGCWPRQAGRTSRGSTSPWTTWRSPPSSTTSR